MNIDKIKTALLKDKKLLALGIAAVLVIVFGGWYIFAPKNQAPQATNTQSDDQLPTLAPSAIGLTTTVRDDQRAVKFTVNKTDGIDAIEYELDYVAKHPQTGEDIQRGIIADPITKDKFQNGVYQSDWIELGSASSGVFRPDIGVRNVVLKLKVTKGGQDYQVTQKVDVKSV